MMSNIGSSKRMKREATIELQMTLIDKFYHQENSENDSVDGILADLTVRDGAISYYNMSMA